MWGKCKNHKSQKSQKSHLGNGCFKANFFLNDGVLNAMFD